MKSVSSSNEAAEAAHHAAGDFLGLINEGLLRHLRLGRSAFEMMRIYTRRQISLILCDIYRLPNQTQRASGREEALARLAHHVTFTWVDISLSATDLYNRTSDKHN